MTNPLAMQKVVGSSPIIRSKKAPQKRGFCFWFLTRKRVLCPYFVPMSELQARAENGVRFQ